MLIDNWLKKEKGKAPTPNPKSSKEAVAAAKNANVEVELERAEADIIKKEGVNLALRAELVKSKELAARVPALKERFDRALLEEAELAEQLLAQLEEFEELGL